MMFFLSAGDINDSVSNGFINAISNFASNGGKRRGGNISAAIAISSNSARLITSGGNAISSGGKGDLIKGKSVA
jgi:hypothetical protein